MNSELFCAVRLFIIMNGVIPAPAVNERQLLGQQLQAVSGRRVLLASKLRGLVKDTDQVLGDMKQERGGGG